MYAHQELQQSAGKNLAFLATAEISSSFLLTFYYRAMKEGAVS